MAPKRPSALYDGFGERKTLREWSKDTRCPVGYCGLMYRVEGGGMSIEQAFATPARRSQLPRFSGFGEERSITLWARDPRCPVSYPVLRRLLTVEGLTVEQVFALTPIEAKMTRLGRPRKRTA
jgi:hypothetical protein